jgi:serine/threonine protein phosphatase PrpC
MNDILKMATGTIPGRRHVGSGNLLVGKNNQDALGTAVSDECFVAVVCDGCSTGAYSEFGARFTAATLPQMVIDEVRKTDMEAEALTGKAFWETIKFEMLAY